MRALELGRTLRVCSMNWCATSFKWSTWDPADTVKAFLRSCGHAAAFGPVPTIHLCDLNCSVENAHSFHLNLSRWHRRTSRPSSAQIKWFHYVVFFSAENVSVSLCTICGNVYNSFLFIGFNVTCCNTKISTKPLGMSQPRCCPHFSPYHHPTGVWLEGLSWHAKHW